jgi:hypothetical protein
MLIWQRVEPSLVGDWTTVICIAGLTPRKSMSLRSLGTGKRPHQSQENLITSTVSVERPYLHTLTVYPVTVSHYAEGSFMPVLVQKLIFDIVPQRSPFYIRPLVSMIFGQLSKQLVEPEIMKHVALVLTLTHHFCPSSNTSAHPFRLKPI